MSNFKSPKIRDGNDPADKELYRIEIGYERNGYDSEYGEKIHKQKRGPFKEYLNTLKEKNPRTNNWKFMTKSNRFFKSFSREEAIFLLGNILLIKISDSKNPPTLLVNKEKIDEVVYKEALNYIWKIHHMRVTFWINGEDKYDKYTVEDSDTVVDENTHFSIDPQTLRVNIDNDNATVIDDEMDGGKKRKTKSRKSKKSSPKRKRRTNRRRR